MAYHTTTFLLAVSAIIFIFSATSTVTAYPSVSLPPLNPSLDQEMLRASSSDAEESAAGRNLPYYFHYEDNNEDYFGRNARSNGEADEAVEGARDETEGNVDEGGIQSYIPSYYGAEEALPGRQKRSWQPGAPDYSRGGSGNNQQSGRNHGVSIDREGPNTRVSVEAQHRGQGADVDGRWSKVVRGPGKAKPEWHVGVKW